MNGSESRGKEEKTSQLTLCNGMQNRALKTYRISCEQVGGNGKLGPHCFTAGNGIRKKKKAGLVTAFQFGFKDASQPADQSKALRPKIRLNDWWQILTQYSNAATWSWIQSSHTLMSFLWQQRITFVLFTMVPNQV